MEIFASGAESEQGRLGCGCQGCAESRGLKLSVEICIFALDCRGTSCSTYESSVAGEVLWLVLTMHSHGRITTHTSAAVEECPLPHTRASVRLYHPKPDPWHLVSRLILGRPSQALWLITQMLKKNHNPYRKPEHFHSVHSDGFLVDKWFWFWNSPIPCWHSTRVHCECIYTNTLLPIPDDKFLGCALNRTCWPLKWRWTAEWLSGRAPPVLPSATSQAKPCWHWSRCGEDLR